MSESKAAVRRRAQAASPGKRTEEILGAAREVFIEKGFAAARVEDVAARAGVAKGTIYLHFESKEALFKALIQSTAEAPSHHMQALLDDEAMASSELLRRALAILRNEVLGTDRRRVLWLVLTEGRQFPDVAAFYHDEVIERIVRLLRAIVERGLARGEFASDALARFPQLFTAPMLMAIVWEGLFANRSPLDVDGLLQAHLDVMLHGIEAKP